MKVFEENLVRGKANYSTPEGTVGGKLMLTAEGLHFKANLDPTKLIRIPFRSIKQVELKNRCYFFPNGIEITTADGKKEHFRIPQRKVWKALIVERLVPESN